MNQCKISVIVPVYNSEKYLEECLNSIVNQSLQNIEIIIVNDGSTDNSGQIINKYSRRYSNIVVISQPNQGVTIARLNGLKKATGDYVAFVDNDDILEPSMYETMYKTAINLNHDVVICNYNLYPKPVASKAVWYNEFKGKVNWEFVHRNSVIWNKLFKKEYLETIKYTNLLKEMAESSFVLMLVSTNKIGTLNKKLYNYRVGHSSLSNYTDIQWYKTGVRTAMLRKEYMAKLSTDQYWATYFEHLIFMSMASLLIACARNNNSVEYKRNKLLIKDKVYLNNKLNKSILIKDYGFFRYLIIRYIFTNSFVLTRTISRAIV